MGTSSQIILEKYWGHRAFRPLQSEIIEAILLGKNALAILPTGAGKSVCYQVPAIALGGVCLVISPLIALMQDQVVNLRSRGISAACLHSAMPKGAVNDLLEKTAKGFFQLLYVAPERLKSQAFLETLSSMDIRLVAIDEAHCISQWGHDFRPDYLNITKIKAYLPQNTRWTAFTATATPKVQQDIIHYLEIPDALIFRKSIYRKNLIYRVIETEAKLSEVVKFFKNSHGSGILYCSTRRKCMEMQHWLSLNKIKALAYHAGLPKEERYDIQKQWTQSSEAVMCATSAFGMGIDKEDVRIVMHLSPPESMESYYQEAGRAGRDGHPAQCILLLDPSDILRLKALPDLQYPSKKFVLQIYRYLCDFLQIPLGAGEKERLPFNLSQFTKNFHLDLLPVMSSLRILERSEILTWEEQSHSPSTIQITADTSEVQQLNLYQPELYPIVTALLRLHNGIFNFPVQLKIWEVAKYLNVDQATIKAGLKKIQSLGIAKIKEAREGDFLTLEKPRSYPNHLDLDVERIKRLKKSFKARVEEMVDFLENTTDCRNVLLEKYFGESHTTKCNRCDNCLATAAENQDPFKIDTRIKEKLKQVSKSDLQNLSSHFPELPEQKLVQHLLKLQEEGFCCVSSNGMIFLQ